MEVSNRVQHYEYGVSCRNMINNLNIKIRKDNTMKHETTPVYTKRGGMMCEGLRGWGKIIIVAIIFFTGFVSRQSNVLAEIDVQKDVYLFLHGRTDLHEKAVNALVSYGFSKEKITLAAPEKVGNVGDYMAMLWKPPEPDHIKLQQITKVEKTEPEKIKGLWKGVIREDRDSIPLDLQKR